MTFPFNQYVIKPPTDGAFQITAEMRVQKSDKGKYKYEIYVPLLGDGDLKYAQAIEFMADQDIKVGGWIVKSDHYKHPEYFSDEEFRAAYFTEPVPESEDKVSAPNKTIEEAPDSYSEIQPQDLHSDNSMYVDAH